MCLHIPSLSSILSPSPSSLTLCQWWRVVWRAGWVRNPFFQSYGPSLLIQCKLDGDGIGVRDGLGDGLGMCKQALRKSVKVPCFFVWIVGQQSTMLLSVTACYELNLRSLEAVFFLLTCSEIHYIQIKVIYLKSVESPTHVCELLNSSFNYRASQMFAWPCTDTHWNVGLASIC